MTDKKLRSIG